MTNDLDICYDASDRANLVALASVLASWDAYPRALGVGFRVLELPSLIKSKRAAGRPRDHEHLPELEALLALGKR